MSVLEITFFSFMDIFSRYKPITICLKYRYKTTFICPQTMFSYNKMPFGLKKVGATFYKVMYSTFHAIKHIIEAYLDNSPTHSKKIVK